VHGRDGASEALKEAVRMAFNPLVVVVGVAVAGVAAVAILTWDQWSEAPAPAEVARTVTPPVTAPAAPPEPQPQPAEQQTAAVAPGVEEPAPAPQPEAAAPAPAVQPPAPRPPAFDIVRVEPDGSALVAGRAEPDATVTISSNGAPLGQARANARGEWVWTSPAPLAPGSYAVTLEAAPPGGGAPLASEQAVAVVVPDRPETPLVVLTAPDAPSTVLQKPEAEVAAVAPPEAAPEPSTAAAPATPAAGPAPASVSLESVDYSDTGDIVFTGRGTPGETVRLYVDNGLAGEALVGPDGTWTWSGAGTIAPGRHTLRADQIGADSKVTSRVELPFQREAAQAVAAAAPAATPEAAPAAAQPGRIVIQPGNNLWNISRVLYGRGTQYTVIYEANRDQIRDPSLIFPGQILETPGTAAPPVIDPRWRKPLSEMPGGAAAN
jgi:nucleoid-associated protein YgaU